MRKHFASTAKKFDEKTVQEWKKAMNKVGQIKGVELTKGTNGHEGQSVKKIVMDVLLMLKKNYTYVDDHVLAMNELLNLDSDESRIVGIHGMGGLGKTIFFCNFVARLFLNLSVLHWVKSGSKSL